MVEDYYPIAVRPRWGHGHPSHQGIERTLLSGAERFRDLLADFQTYEKYFQAIPYEPTSATAPYWNNPWFSTLDAAALIYFLGSKAPKTYIEIGSGLSTRFARSSISTHGIATDLVSIDPLPRSEIDALCDEVIRAPLEELELSLFDRLGEGDIVFFDGSHRVFTNSDTTVFFMEVMPRLSSGVLIHIHDIFLPDDYTPDWDRRLYSEQYLLGAMMLSGMSRYRVVLPNYFVSTNPATSSLVKGLGIPTTYPESSRPGLSFWIEVV